MLFIHNPLRHLEAIRRWSDAAGAVTQLSARTWTLSVAVNTQSCLLQPRFVVRREGVLGYSCRFEDLGTFVGWSPVGIPSWPLAQDKYAFKLSLMTAGFRVPAAGDTAEALKGDFIVKSRTGSFGREMRGPYKAYAATAAGPLPSNSYYEQFIDGRAAKVWCCAGEVVALEVMERPYLMGDGMRTLGELARQRGSMDKPVLLDTARAMLHWQNVREDSVIERDEKIWLDYRYATPFDRPVPWDCNVWTQTSEPVRQQFIRAAAHATLAIPPECRARAVFTLDAVLDAWDGVWFLEMNSHPMVHPAAYPLMLAHLGAGKTPSYEKST
jgi:hypothetical protein